MQSITEREQAIKCILIDESFGSECIRTKVMVKHQSQQCQKGIHGTVVASRNHDMIIRFIILKLLNLFAISSNITHIPEVYRGSTIFLCKPSPEESLWSSPFLSHTSNCNTTIMDNHVCLQYLFTCTLLHTGRKQCC